MKKIYAGLALGATLVISNPAYALFTNGGFETGDFSGWTLSGSGASLSEVIDNTGTQPGQTLDVDPYNGNYMARINNIYGGYHSTTLSQTDTISQQDIDNGATLYVNWGAMLVEPSNSHPSNAQPYFSIEIDVNGSQYSYFTANALAHGSDPTWVNAGYNGGNLWYKHDTWSLDLSTLSLGDSVTVKLFARDCTWGAHGGYAFLDGIGTINPSNVPEPATMLLFGTGLAGLAGLRRRQVRK